MPLDLSKPPKPPRWVVKDFLARGWLTMVHAKWGSGKSMLYQTLIGAALVGEPWLGRSTSSVERVLVIDEENPVDVVIARLKAAGYDHELHQERLLYFDQIGCRLGERGWDEQLLYAVDQFRPDLLATRHGHDDRGGIRQSRAGGPSAASLPRPSLRGRPRIVAPIWGTVDR